MNEAICTKQAGNSIMGCRFNMLASPSRLFIPTAGYSINMAAGSGHTVSSVPDSYYWIVIRFFTSFTPFMSFASLVARFFSAALLALPYNVTTPRFDSTLVLMALVER